MADSASGVDHFILLRMQVGQVHAVCSSLACLHTAARAVVTCMSQLHADSSPCHLASVGLYLQDAVLMVPQLSQFSLPLWLFRFISYSAALLQVPASSRHVIVSM